MDTATLESPAATTGTTPSPAPAAPASTGADSGFTDSSTSSVVDSGSDLLADLPDNLFGSVDSASDPAPSDDDEDLAPDDDTDQPEEQGDEDDEGLEDDPGDGVETQAQEQGKPGEKQEELPEGVTRGKDRNGKQGLFVEENRWKNIYNNHQLVQKTTEILGEPATLEALQLRNDAYVAQEQLYNDLTSGDPQAQGQVLGYFFDEMARARQDGEVGVDGTVPFATSFYQTLREKSPDGYANLRYTAARDLIGEMFTEAAEKGDESLRLSAQHFARVLAGVPANADPKQIPQMIRQRGVPFYTKDEMTGLKQRTAADPTEALRQENARLRAERDGTSTTNVAAQRQEWVQQTDQAVSQSILNDAIKPALSAVEKEWSKFPKQFERLVRDPLHSQVFDAIRNDKAFEGRIRLLKEQALRSPSAQKRAELGEAVKNLYLNRAKLAVDAAKGQVFREAAEFFQERVNQRHERRQAAQNRTAPSGSNGTVPRTAIPRDLIDFKDGVFDSDTAIKQARQLLGL